MRVPLRVFQLGSGSSGNLTLLEGPRGALLVDAGFPAREILRRVEEAGIERRRIQCLILTHAHLDHARGAGVLARRLGIPILAAPWTLENLGGLRGREELRPLPLEGSFQAAGLRFQTRPAPHDIPGTLLLRVEDRLGIATDLGHAGEETAAFLSGLEVLLLEFNHDTALLRSGPYPPRLKARILSPKGHLSNDQAEELLRRPGFRPPTRALWLCHLSRKNNRPHLALEAARRALDGLGTQILTASPGGDRLPLLLPAGPPPRSLRKHRR